MNARSVLVLVLVAGLAGCAARSANIAQLKVDPGRFHDRTVRIEGVVTHTLGATPAAGSVYKIDDGSGEITVISTTPVMLTRGARVRVTGTLQRQPREGQAAVVQLHEHGLDVLSSGN